MIKRLFVIVSFTILMLAAFPMVSMADGSYTAEEEEAAKRIESKTYDLYQSVMERANRGMEIENMMDNPNKWITVKIYSAYKTVKAIALPVSAFSIFGGLLVAWIVKSNKWLWRRIILSFVIGLPVLLCLFVFGVGALIG